MPGSLLAEGFRRAVLDFLVENGALSGELRRCMLASRHGGFAVHNEVSVAAEDAEGRKMLAGYMLRAPMSVQKMTYDVATGTVIYRSKMHAGLKRNFPVMPGEEPATVRESSGASSSTSDCGHRPPPGAARRSVLRVGAGTPTCR